MKRLVSQKRNEWSGQPKFANNINNAIKRISRVDDNDDVRIFVSQQGLYDKLKKRFSYYSQIEVIKVEPGNQAVDNRIKSVLGYAIRSGKYEELYVISKDKGYDELIQKYRCTFKKRKNKLDRRDCF